MHDAPVSAAMPGMKACPRWIVILSGLVAFTLAAGALAYFYRASIAVAMAPEKSADATQSDLAKNANTKFWEGFHGGRYDGIPVVLEALTAA